MTKITLYSPSLGTSGQFSAEHAERLLSIPGSGWELRDKRFSYDRRNGIRRVRNKKEDN